MTTFTTTASPAEPGFRPGLLFRGARAGLLLLLAVIYAGCIQFFITFSPSLLYGTYVVITGAMAICLFFRWPLIHQGRSVAPYLIWTMAYFLWAVAASDDALIPSEALKLYIKNFLVIGALAVALNRCTLRRFAQLVMLAVIGNFVLCIFETIDPTLVSDIAQSREADATAFNVLRPAGLWSNPDEAASAFIFGLLMARWARGALGFLGRLAAIAGIYLSASRTGAYLLALCAVVHFWVWLREHGVTPESLAKAVGVLLLTGIAIGALIGSGWVDLSDSWQLNRILDFTEETRDADHVSRVDIAKNALRTALQGPWYGHGLFAFQGEAGFPAVIDPPAHNIFLTIFGEAGPVLGVTYLLVLGFGLRQVAVTPLTRRDRRTLYLMWLCYLLTSLTWHNNFTAFSGMIYIGLLWHLPSVLQLAGADAMAIDQEIVLESAPVRSRVFGSRKRPMSSANPPPRINGRPH